MTDVHDDTSAPDTGEGPDGGTAAEPAWYKDPEFWDVMRPFVFPEARLDAAANEVEELLSLLAICNAPPIVEGTRVLDVPCGPGRHSVALAGTGCHVTGYDLMPDHVEAARTRAADAGVDAVFEAADMYSLELPASSFDVALNLFTSIGYTDTEDDDVRLFTRIHDALTPGGAFVVDTMGKEVLARRYERRRYHEVDGWMVHETVDVQDAWRRIVVSLEFLRDGEERRASFAHRVYGASDLARLLERAGFSVRFFGALDGRTYGPGAERLVAVAIKGGAA